MVLTDIITYPVTIILNNRNKSVLKQLNLRFSNITVLIVDNNFTNLLIWRWPSWCGQFRSWSWDASTSRCRDAWSLWWHGSARRGLSRSTTRCTWPAASQPWHSWRRLSWQLTLSPCHGHPRQVGHTSSVVIWTMSRNSNINQSTKVVNQLFYRVFLSG